MRYLGGGKRMANKKNKKKRWIIITIIVLVIVALYFWISTNTKKALSEYAKSSIIETVAKKDNIEVKITENGVIEPNRKSEVFAPMGGTVTIQSLEIGDTVNKDGRIFRIGGYLHADIVPYTAQDTAIFKSITGDWTWDRRPVWVSHNRETSAASLHSMPHTDYPQYFNNNDMFGHVCLHFLNSRTHEDNAGTVEAVDARHQKCINEAYEAGKR